MTRRPADVKGKIARAVDALAGEMADINKSIFDNPETCYRETYAAGLLAEKLSGAGFAVTSPYAGLKTAFKAAHAGPKTSSPKVALIAEYDALPGLGHACGHSLIAASAYGAAVALARAAPDHPGVLLVIGSPAEEGGGGKIEMIAKKGFKGIDAALMVHPSNKTRVVSRMFAITELEFTFTGKAAHAAAFPDQGVNALDAGVLFYNAVAALRQQLRAEARVHGIFTHGGDAPNIIPEKIVMRFYVRALDPGYFRELVDKVIRCARGAAKSAGCAVRFRRRGHSYDPFIPSYPIGGAFRKNMALAGLAEDGFGETEEIGSSDIGNLSMVVPTLHPEYAIGSREDINHSRNFLAAVVSEKGLSAMAAMTRAMAMTAYDLLTDTRLMATVKAAFKRP